MKLFHSHTWAKWSALVPSYRGHNMQFRQCDTCGKIQVRSIGYCSGASHIDANAALSDVSTQERQL